MNRSIYSIGLFCCLLAFAVGASSNEDRPTSDSESSSSQTTPTWGPYTAEGVVLSERTAERFGWMFGDLAFYPYAQAMAVYDDNIFLNSYDKKSEAYTVFSPGIMVVYGSARKNYLYMDYSADFTSLQEFNNDAFDGQTLKTGGRFSNARSQFGASYQYQEIRDVDVVAGTRLKQDTSTAEVEYDNRVSSKSSLGVRGLYSLHTFAESGYSAYSDYSVAGRFGWQMMPRAWLTARAGHGWVDMHEERDAYGSAQYDELALGVSGRPRARLETSGDVGVQRRYFESESLDDIVQWVGSIRVAGEPFGRTRVWVAGSAVLRPAIQADGYTALDKRIEPGISRSLFTERLVGGCSVFWGQTDYMGSGSGEGDPRVYDGRHDDHWGFNANLDWWIGRYWSVGIGYSYIKNDSQADDELTMGEGVDPSSYEAGRWMLRAAFNR